MYLQIVFRHHSRFFPHEGPRGTHACRSFQCVGMSNASFSFNVAAHLFGDLLPQPLSALSIITPKRVLHTPLTYRPVHEGYHIVELQLDALLRACQGPTSWKEPQHSLRLLCNASSPLCTLPPLPFPTDTMKQLWNYLLYALLLQVKHQHPRYCRAGLHYTSYTPNPPACQTLSSN